MLPDTTEPTIIYLSPTGSDVQSGTNPMFPVKTLERAEQVINDLQLDTDVEIRIAQGVYVAGQTSWSTFIPGHTISFMPVDYQYGMNSLQFAGRPIFRGTPAAEWWLYAQLPQGNGGMDTGLRFYYLQVESYQNGLMIHGRYTTDANGLRVPSTTGANGNTVYGMNFRKLGSKWSGRAGYGVAAVDLVNSSNNEIRANHFLNLENVLKDDWSHIHGVYLAHGSSHNAVVNNEFKTISADGVRIRNQSNYTDVYGNIFDHVGMHASLVDWFCDGDCVTATNPQECASYGAEFYNNVLGLGYTGQTVPHVLLVPDGQTYFGPMQCPALYSGVRVQEWDNA